ncbi:hypothetical protein Ciccas_000531 [Cichlidogyrus casuarinus]|uniref:galactosylceramidase n=1 Tax=Cichlidogyrus casuarinus TaxID=1844966 RepID=A0ABD2QMM8_9PLAT
MVLWLILLTCICSVFQVDSTELRFNADGKLGRRFEGIGAISGGGATTKLLRLYPEDKLAEIIDVLFKPDFMASLHALKVEIGGDAQSTEGTEASHMHSEDDENYERGYEWLLMKEAKERNPKLVFHSLPWAFPGWCKTAEKTALYVTKWLLGAQAYHNITVSTVGCWNEKVVQGSYIHTLRKTLDDHGLQHVGIVALDLTTYDEILDMLKKDASLKDAIKWIGIHYPHVASPDEAQDSGIPLMASEEYSTFNDDQGAACWARVIFFLIFLVLSLDAESELREC